MENLFIFFVFIVVVYNLRHILLNHKVLKKHVKDIVDPFDPNPANSNSQWNHDSDFTETLSHRSARGDF